MVGKRIGIDLDGVLADFDLAFKGVTKYLFGKPQDVRTPTTDWDWTELGLTKREIDAAWVYIKKIENFWMTLRRLDKEQPPWSFPEAKEEVFFITHRVTTAGLPVETQCIRWLMEIYDIPDEPSVIVTHRPKGPICAALDITHFVDDKPENVYSIREHCPEASVYLYDRPYNQEVNRPDIIRVKSIDEFRKGVYSDATRTVQPA